MGDEQAPTAQLMTRRVLVTGASGFVGRRLVGALHGAGVSLTLAGRSVPPHLAGARQIAIGDLGGEIAWDEALDGAGAVVHLAGLAHAGRGRSPAQSERFDAVNHRGALRLFEAAARSGIGRFVFVSTVLVLGGASSQGRPLDEDTPPDPRTPYARSKLASEDGLRRLALGSATELVILRPPLVAGPGVRGNLAALARLAALPLSLPLGGIRNRRTLLSLDNLVAAIQAVLGHSGRLERDSFVLGDPEPVSTSDIVRHLREGLGRPAHLLPAPEAAIGWLSARLGRADMRDRLLGDLVVESSRFRDAFAFRDVTTTAESLREASRAIALRRGR